MSWLPRAQRTVKLYAGHVILTWNSAGAFPASAAARSASRFPSCREVRTLRASSEGAPTG
jgi:hypothetical protein